MPSFRDWIAGRTAVTVADADELYVRDDSLNDSKRITWSSLKAALFSSPTFTGTVTTPGLKIESPYASLDLEATIQTYINFRDATGNIRFNLSENSAGENLLIQQRDASGAFIRTPFEINSAGEVRLSLATAVAVPAATGAGQAAQVSAIDATTGQLAIGGVEMGDSGPRDIKGSLLNSWASSDAGAAPIILHRNGNVVTIGGRIDGSASTNTTAYSLPTGFRASNNNVATGVAMVSGVTLYSVYLNGTTSIIFGSNANGQRFSMSWITDDAWPTSLPGTAA